MPRRFLPLLLTLAAASLSGSLPTRRDAVAAEPPAATDGGGPVTASQNDGTEKQDAVKLLRDIQYTKLNETSLLANVYVPAGKGPYPGVLMVHGGAWRGGNRWHMHRDAMLVAEHDYTVVSISYRLAPKHPFPAQLEDCQTALAWLRQSAATYKIDASRVAGYGYSAGGHLVSLLGAMDAAAQGDGAGPRDDRPRQGLQAVVAGGAPCNFNWIPAENRALAYWLGGSRKTKPAAYRKASPISFVTRDDPPMFFFHGAWDQLVPAKSPAQMRDRLKAVGVDAELHVIEETGHVQAFLGQKAVPAAIQFLDRVLKPQRPNAEK